MLGMPKKKRKASVPEQEQQNATRVPTQEREEEEFSFNCYSRKTVKLKVVCHAETEIVDLKKKGRR